MKLGPDTTDVDS